MGCHAHYEEMVIYIYYVTRLPIGHGHLRSPFVLGATRWRSTVGNLSTSLGRFRPRRYSVAAGTKKWSLSKARWTGAPDTYYKYIQFSSSYITITLKLLRYTKNLIALCVVYHPGYVKVGNSFPISKATNLRSQSVRQSALLLHTYYSLQLSQSAGKSVWEH